MGGLAWSDCNWQRHLPDSRKDTSRSYPYPESKNLQQWLLRWIIVIDHPTTKHRHSLLSTSSHVLPHLRWRLSPSPTIPDLHHQIVSRWYAHVDDVLTISTAKWCPAHPVRWEHSDLNTSMDRSLWNHRIAHWPWEILWKMAAAPTDSLHLMDPIPHELYHHRFPVK